MSISTTMSQTMIQLPATQSHYVDKFGCIVPNCTRLMAKLHVFKNFMEHHTQDEFYRDHIYKYRRQRTHTCVSKQNKKHLIYAAFHKAVHPKWNPDIITPKLTITGLPARIETRYCNLCVKKKQTLSQAPILSSNPIYIE